MVLAGGRSSRFGSDKLAATYRGRPLLDHAVTALAAACGDVVVVLGPDAQAPALDAVVALVRDAEPGQGPLAGLATALPHVTTTWLLLAAGDMPDLSPAVLVEMLRVADEAPVDGVALADEGRARPLPSTLRTEACREVVPALLDAGERRLRMVLDALRIALIDEVTWTALDPARGTLRDIDTPEDLLPGGERRLPGFGATPG